MRSPNIVLCIADQLRPFALGCYGDRVIRSPNIDRLAAGGVRFETAVTNYPVCMAARSVLLSGQHNRTCTGGIGNVCYESRPGDYNMPEYPERGRPHLKAPTLPELLRDRGYHTSVIGKWHIHSWPDDIGFDDYLIPRVHHCHSGQSFTENGGPEFVPGGYSVDYEAERVERLVAQRRDKPFFLYYSISPPHCPVADAPEKYLKMYSPDEIPLRPNVDPANPFPKPDYWYRVYRYDFRYYNLHVPYTDDLPRGYDLRTLVAEYYGLVTWVDDCVGRMLAALDRAGLAEDTIVVFTSDHGDLLGSHGLPQKGPPLEESARIPLLIRWPAKLASRVVTDQVASLVDVMPTLLRMVGGSVPGHVQGRDLMQPGLTHSFIEGPGNCVAVRTPTHMYGVDGRGNPKYHFDCVADPYQMKNIPGPAPELDALVRAWGSATPWMGK